MFGRFTAAAVPVAAALVVGAPGASVVADAPFEAITLHGPSLEGNLEGDSADRRVYVYLPPSYAKEPGRRFPVVYLLHGYGGGPDVWNNLHHLREDLNRAFAHGSRELIVVAPDAQTLHIGSFYSNSVTIGDWERFIADDLVRYVDGHYRTIPTRDSRAISGFSIGGYGTLRIAMKRPTTFSAIYAMSSCCLTPMGLRPGAAALEQITTLEAARTIDRGQRVSLAFAAAWAPNPNKPPLYFDTPIKNGEPQPEVIAAMSANAAITMIHQHIPALKSLKAIGRRSGCRTACSPVTSGCTTFSMPMGSSTAGRLTRAITETDSASGSRRVCLPFSQSTWHSSSARRHVVMPTAEHCDSEERVTCEQSG